MNQDQLRDQIATVVAKCHGFASPAQFDHEVASRVWAKVVAPLLAERRAAEQRLIGELADTRGRLGEAQGNLWEAREHLTLSRDERDRAEASRRDWATEALRLDLAAEANHCCTGAHNCSANVHIEGCFYSDEDDPRHPRFVLPCGHTNAEAQRSIQHELCSVHPDGGDR